MAACKAIASLFGSRSSLFINNTKLGFIKTIIPNESKRQFATLTSAFGRSSTFSENKYIKKIKNDRQIHVSRSCLDASKDNYYRILGIEKNSSSEDVKKAYVCLAKKYLCDTDENDLEARIKFQEVEQAYEALKDNEDNNDNNDNNEIEKYDIGPDRVMGWATSLIPYTQFLMMASLFVTVVFLFLLVVNLLIEFFLSCIILVKLTFIGLAAGIIWYILV